MSTLQPGLPTEPVDLVSPRSGITLILTADEVQYLPNGGQRITKRGKKVKFAQGRATVSPEDFMLVLEHPAFTGDGEPRQVFTMDDADLMPQLPSGPEVVTGPIHSRSGSKAREPIPGYDRMQYGAIRRALQEGRFDSVVDALVYERAGRSREGVLKLFAAALAGAEKLPTVQTMRNVDKMAGRPDSERVVQSTTPAPEPELPPLAELEATVEAPVVEEALSLGDTEELLEAEAVAAGIDAAAAAEEVTEALEGLGDDIDTAAEAEVPEEGVE